MANSAAAAAVVTNAVATAATCTFAAGRWTCQFAEGHTAVDVRQRRRYADLHQALLTRNNVDSNDACAQSPTESYNLNIHIVAVFVLLITSALGVTLPALIAWIERRRKRSGGSDDGDVQVQRRRIANVIFAFQHFGSGIILSTAFVHLLFEAFETFANPCIGPLAYDATSSAIAMASIFMMFCLDFLALRPLRKRACLQTGSMLSGGLCSHVATTSDDDDSLKAHHRLAKFEVITLEAGVIFHSVIIGVTLGTSGGDGWTSFFVAIAIHQFCEGVALASRIVILHNTSRATKWSMYAAFALVTSVGIAIGIGVRSQFNENDPSTILTIGVLNSISAGILIYSALVQILAGDFIHNQGMLFASTQRALTALALIALGCAIMSILGKWA